MKKVNGLVLAVIIAICLTPVLVFSQEVIVPPSGDEIMALIEALGGIKGLGGVAIAALVIQGVMLLVRTKLGEMLGKYRLVIVLALSAVAGVLASVVSGMGVGAAIVSGSALAAYQVLFNQVYRQFFVKKD